MDLAQEHGRGAQRFSPQPRDVARGWGSEHPAVLAAELGGALIADGVAGHRRVHGLRQEVGADIRVTVISPGVTTSELAESISDPEAREVMRDFRKGAIPAEAIARSIAYAISQPADVDVSEIIIRPTSSPY